MLAGGVDTGWTFYTPYQHHLLQYLRHRHRARRLHRRLLVHPHRAEFHRHHPPHARARHDLVPPAAVRLGALRHQPDPGPGHAGAGRHPGPGGCRARLPHRHLRSGPRRRPGAVPAPVLVLLPSRRLHHGAAGHGRHQRAGLHLLPQAGLRLRLRRFLQRRHRRPRLPGLGPPHVRQQPVGLCRHGVLVPQLLRRDSLGHQGLQLDRHLIQGVDFVCHAHAVRLRLHRPVHHRRADRPVPRHPGHRRARHRHLLRRGPLPLHHGGRDDHGATWAACTSGGRR